MATDDIRRAKAAIEAARTLYGQLVEAAETKALYDAGEAPNMADWATCLDELHLALGQLYRCGQSTPDRVEVLSARMRDCQARMDRIALAVRRR